MANKMSKVVGRLAMRAWSFFAIHTIAITNVHEVKYSTYYLVHADAGIIICIVHTYIPYVSTYYLVHADADAGIIICIVHISRMLRGGIMY